MISLKMDVQYLKAFSCPKQSIVYFILFEADRQGLILTDNRVIATVINHFNGSVPLFNHCFNYLVAQLTQSCQDSRQ